MNMNVSFIQSRVGRRIFALFVVCALVPVCVLALITLQKVSARLEVYSQKRLSQVGMNSGMSIHEGLGLLQTELESMPVSAHESGSFSRQASPKGRNKRFRSVTVTNDDAVGGAIPGMSGRLSREARAHLAAGNALILSSGNLGSGDPIRMVTSANPNLPSHGLLVGEIHPEYLWNLVGSTLTSGIDICILGPTGKTLFASRPLPVSLASRVMSDQKGSYTGQFVWQRGGDDLLVNYWSIFLKPVFLADSWTVVSIQARQESLKPARSFLTTFLLVVLLTLCTVVFVSSVLIRRSLVPLSTLKEGAQRLSQGDFGSRVEIASGDEFEDLAVAFNDMSEQLGRQFGRLSEMGRLVQGILEAHDHDTVIDAVMSRFRNSVPCDWLAVSLVNGSSDYWLATTFSTDAIPSGCERFESLLSGEELRVLLETDVSLRVSAGSEFSTLISPIAAEGAGEFFLLPISIKERLLGILILGYRSVPERIREELLRSRQVADEIAISLDNVRLIDELHWLNRGTIETLANAVDAKSSWTAGHSERVTRLALEIGKEMGLSGKDRELLQLGGMFHDMGKIGVPEVVLDKPGRLTDEESALVRKHPEKGADILRPIRAYHSVIPIVAQHHEQYDGQGYPLGLAGQEIALGARILAVADVFDALYSDRPYRQGWEFDRVMSYLEENAGSQFDPEVVRAFMKIDRSVYLGSCATAVRSGCDANGNTTYGLEGHDAAFE